MSFYQNKPIVSYETWITAILSSAVIGCTSLVPWLFNLTFFERHKIKLQPEGDGRMKYLLSFSIGAILGDIFFHLIPESYHSHLVELNHSEAEAHEKVGLSIICGIFMFIVVEMMIEKWSKSEDVNDKTADVRVENFERPKEPKNCLNYLSQDKDLKQSRNIHSRKNIRDMHESNNNSLTDFNIYATQNNDKTAHVFNEKNDDQNNNESQFHQPYRKQTQLRSSNTIKHGFGCEGNCDDRGSDASKVFNDKSSGQTVETAGYLSLIANGFDNFTHGLAIGASFLVGPKVGLLTTFVIFIHEIPHEICDYAILVNSGFSRLDAVKAQSSVSLFGILGTAIALYVKSLETLNSKTIWILPFSAGGFLYIALVNLLPQILEQDGDTRNSVGQVACVVLGISFMALIAVL